MEIVYKIIFFFPMLPLPGAAYFLLRAVFEERTQKKILYLSSCNTLLILFVSTIVLIIYINAILDEGRKNHKSPAKKDMPEKKNSFATIEKENIHSEISTESVKTIREYEEKPEKSEEAAPSIDNYAVEEGDNVKVSEKYPQSSTPPVYIDHDREKVQYVGALERQSVVIVNTNIIQNSAAPAILKVSAASSSVYHLDQDFMVWINETNMKSSYTKRQLDKLGLPALYQILDRNGLPIAEGEKYEYLMTQEPCRVEKRRDGSLCVVKKGKAFFQKC